MPNEVKFTVRLNIQGQQQVVQVTTDAEDLKNAIQEVKNAADKVGNSRGWEDLMLGINQAMEVAQRLKGSIDSLANDYMSWETAMAKVNTMAGLNADEFQNLTDKVSELSKQIPKTKEELADGLYQVISNGVPEPQWLSFLEQSAKASTGGIADLAETVKVTSTVIKNYGLEWDKAGYVQDKIQTTAKNGVTSFEELAGALPRVTANAATLGVSIDELMASFATLTGVSGNTAEVSTQLAAIFTALIKPSAEATKMAQEMGVQFDAAAIKAAGGMQQFIAQLDTAINQYAQAHGMLTEEIYGKLFGSAESLRALIPLTGELKDKFTQNINAMADSTGTIQDAFNTMADTGQSKMQMLENTIRTMIEPLAQVATIVKPVTDTLFQFGMAAMGVKSLTTAIVALKNSHILAKVATIAHTAATRALGTVSAATGISVTALKTAVRGLMIATGVGAAIAALTFVIEKLSSASDKAADSQNNLATAEENAKNVAEAGAQAYGEAKVAMDQNIAITKNFNGTKEEEKKIVDRLNSTYGDTMGYFSSVAQWYQALTANSETYCRQMVLEAQTRTLANQIAEKEQKKYNLLYDEKGNRKLYSTKREQARENVSIQSYHMGMQGGTRPVPGEIVGTSELDKVNAQISDLNQEIAAGTNRLKGLAEKASKLDFKVKGAPTPPPSVSPHPASNPTKFGRNTPSTQNTGPQLTQNAKTYKELADNVAFYKKAIESADKNNIIHLALLIKNKAAAEKELDAYKKLTEGIEDMTKFNQDAYKQSDIQQNISILQKQLSELTPNTPAYQKVSEEIDRWNRKLSGTVAGSVEDIEQKIQKITERLNKEPLSLRARIDLNAQRDQLQKQLDELAETVKFNCKLENGEALKDFKTFAEQWKKSQKEQDKEKLTQKLQGQKDKLKDVQQLVSSVGQSFSSMGKDMKVPALEAAGILASAIATIIQGYATATAQAATLGPFSWAAFSLAGLAQVASVVAQVKEIGKYAQGGIAYGPTIGLFGEYPGAANNPEVVAPLNRLRSLLDTPGSNLSGKVKFHIQGRTLVGVLEKEYNHTSRM